MSQEYANDYAWPSSLSLELEALRLHATSRAAGLADAAPGAILSGFPQAFDLFVGVLLSTLVFPQTIFAGLAHGAAIGAGLAVWLLAYAVRPLGARVFSGVARRHGRGVSLTAARFLFGSFTAAIAFLPLTPGAQAVALLISARALQGFALGGVSAGALAGARFGGQRRLCAAAVRWLAGPVGLLAAGGLFAVFEAILAPDDLMDWGWRYPFIMAVPANIVALFADLRLLGVDPSEPKPRLAVVSGVERR